MQIDFHTHCFPDKIAERAVGKLYSICGITPQTNGTYDDTCRAMKEWGTDIAVLFNIATNAHQQTSVNNFAASHNDGPTRAFGSVHPLSLIHISAGRLFYAKKSRPGLK